MMAAFRKDIRIKCSLALFLCILSSLVITVSSQELPSFGFDSPDSSQSPQSTSSESIRQTLRMSGEMSAGTNVFIDDLKDGSSREYVDVGDLFSGKINLLATGSRGDGYLSVDADNTVSIDSPFSIDEAFVRAYLGKVDVEIGLRKITWGRADSQGPLDVINPQDHSDLTVLDELERKIARPLLRLSLSLSPMARFETVYLPSFKGDQFARDGRWMPGDMVTLQSSLALLSQLYMIPGPDAIEHTSPSTSALGNSQIGFRFTNTFGSADVGLQYFYGYLKRPAISLVVTPGTSILVREEYNRYHQVGFDLATVLAGINLRGEFGANITEDISGDDPSIYNPSLVWSLGFDSSLFAGITFNVQVAGSVRLFDDDVGSKPFDIEDGSDITKTRITTIVSRKFLRDQLEIKGTMISGIEDTDYYLIPSASWTRDDIVFELSAGFFGGSRDGELGCYRENDYLSASITLAF
ncbi:MAG: hypothetical protein JW875_09500 [Spirochaetales bacterium]|nr:hypothetical protein [Spirochaetales bacterium]